MHVVHRLRTPLEWDGYYAGIDAALVMRDGRRVPVAVRRVSGAWAEVEAVAVAFDSSWRRLRGRARRVATRRLENPRACDLFWWLRQADGRRTC